MGLAAALKARKIFDNASYVIAIELLCSEQGLDFRKPLRPGAGAEAAYRLVRCIIPHLEDDRILHHDINKTGELILKGEVVSAMEDVVE